MNDQKPNLKSFKTYRDKIFFRVILTTIALMLIDSPLAFVFAHPLASLLWEWWYFSFQKVKESAMLPQWYLEAKEITPEEVDNYIKFTVTARRLFALVGILLCLI
ncbi:MAG TPA: hypothetical protein VNJ29_01640, partial [Candidatus Nitrosotenuis sp.]|nr:hypothetical protein [Candidatus Nitrosotenuis sp.]